MKFCVVWLLFSLLGSADVVLASPEGKVIPEHLVPGLTWTGPQFLQADSRANFFLLRPETLEVYPFDGRGALGEARHLETAPETLARPEDPVIVAAMTANGDWVIQQGPRVRLFRNAKEYLLDDPDWSVFAVGAVGDEPVVSGIAKDVLTGLVLKGTPDTSHLMLAWQGRRWEPFGDLPTNKLDSPDASVLDANRTLRLLGTSEGHLWAAFLYRHRLQEYSASGRLLTDIVVDGGEIRQVADAEARRDQAAKAEADLARQGLKVSISEMTAERVAITLAEGRDGRLYFLIHGQPEAGSSGIDLERYDPVGVTLEVLHLPIPDPGMGTMAFGKDALYIAAFQAKNGIWRIPLEQLDAADWKPVPGFEVRAAGDDLDGAWREKGGRGVIRFAKDRVIAFEDGRLTVRGLVSLEGTEALLRRSGFGETWKVEMRQGTLRIERDGGAREYTRLREIPESVSLTPAPLGKARDLPAERITAIQAELAARVARAQAARQKAEENARRLVDADNLQYLRGLTAEVGWIDLKRFGIQAASDAATLAQESLDLPLMLAMLPFTEKDLKSSAEGGAAYSAFYDTLQIALGGKQRYGTQIVSNTGEPLVLPVENRAQIDSIRKKIGLSPLAEYLALASRTLYQGKTVRVAEGEVVEMPKPSSGEAALVDHRADRRRP